MTRPEPGQRTGKPRVQRRLSVRFGTDAKMCGGVVLDISDGGMRIESPESFPVNSVITVFVQFPRHSVRLRARVIWCSAAGGGAANMGLAMTQPEPPLKRAFTEWLAEVKLAAAETSPADTAEAAGPPPPPPRPQPGAGPTDRE